MPFASRALWRLETMALMSDVDLPVAHVRAQVVSAIDLVVHTARLRDAGGSVFQIAGRRRLQRRGRARRDRGLRSARPLAGQARAHERTMPADPGPDFFQPGDQQFGVL